MNKTEELKQKIKLHLKLLAESNRCGSEIDVTTIDIYNLFKVYIDEVSREAILHYEFWTSLEENKKKLAELFDKLPSWGDYILTSINLWLKEQEEKP